MDEIRWQINRHKTFSLEGYSFLQEEQIKHALRFHQTMPDYFPTPLHSLTSLAKDLGIDSLFIKDESNRFHLQSFKGLGSSYAVANLLATECGEKLVSFSPLKDKIKVLPIRTFASATAGNHGRGLAWTAKQLGQEAVIYLPKGSSPQRLKKIRELGAQAEIIDLHYDDAVRFTSQSAQEHGWIHVQDTAWEGYTDIPALIMQGYLTIVGEYLEQSKARGRENPTHVILQAGVGSFAGAIAGALQHMIKTPLTFIIVEPLQADGFYQSGRSVDGEAKQASGNLATIMAGLACREVNPIAWKILKNSADHFMACSDHLAANGMGILANPLNDDPKIISGASGAIPLGFLVEVCKNSHYSDIKEALGLNSRSRLLLFNTEGDTDS